MYTIACFLLPIHVNQPSPKLVLTHDLDLTEVLEDVLDPEPVLLPGGAPRVVSADKLPAVARIYYDYVVQHSDCALLSTGVLSRVLPTV